MTEHEVTNHNIYVVQIDGKIRMDVDGNEIELTVEQMDMLCGLYSGMKRQLFVCNSAYIENGEKHFLQLRTKYMNDEK